MDQTHYPKVWCGSELIAGRSRRVTNAIFADVRLFPLAVWELVFLVVFAASALALPSRATATVAWKHAAINERSGQINAALHYETTAGHGSPSGIYRRVKLVVRRAGRVLIDYQIRGGRLGTQPGGVLGITGRPHLTLKLESVWGDSLPEAVVNVFDGGQICCWIAYVGLITRHSGRVVSHEFGVDWHGQRYHGRFEFVSHDKRFSCAFASCAASVLPVEIFAIGREGTRFVNITRMRRQAVETQAAVIWKAYVRDRRQPTAGGKSEGDIAAWCADQYLLMRKDRCDSALDQAITRHYLAPGVGQAFVDLIHTRLAAWGYTYR